MEGKEVFRVPGQPSPEEVQEGRARAWRGYAAPQEPAGAMKACAAFAEMKPGEPRLRGCGGAEGEG